MALIPVAKSWSEKFRGCCPRTSLDDKMLAIKKILRVVRITTHVRRKTGKRCKGGIGPLPTVADEFFDAPAARSGRMGSDRFRRPRSKIEIAVPPCRWRITPGITAIAAIRPAVTCAVKFGLRRQPFPAPGGKSTR